MKIDFESQQEVALWRSVNDGVMGGQSSGGPRHADGRMIFEGSINTSGGGFSSIRRPIETGTFDGVSGLNMRIKSDGRAYDVTLRTDAEYLGRPVAFQASIPETEPGMWTEVAISFDTVKATLFGRPVEGAEFNNAAAQSLGIIIADSRDGPFRLEIDWIAACQNEGE